MLEELVGRGVQDRAAQGFLAAHFLDESLLKQGLHGIVAFDPSHLLHLALGGGLTVGDYGQRFHGRLREGLALHGLKHALHVGRVFRARFKAQMVAVALDGDAALLLIHGALQLFYGADGFQFADSKRRAQVIDCYGLSCDEQNGLDDLGNLLRLDRLHCLPSFRVRAKWCQR